MKPLLPTATRLYLAAFVICAVLIAHAAPCPAKPAPQRINVPALSGDYLVPDLVSNAKLNAKGTYLHARLAAFDGGHDARTGTGGTWDLAGA